MYKVFFFCIQISNCEYAQSKHKTHTHTHKKITTDSPNVNEKKMDDDISSNMTLEWRVLSIKPKILQLNNFMSDFEIEHMKTIAKKTLKRSRVGAGTGNEDRTRTSSNAWVKRQDSDVLDHITRRLADATMVFLFFFFECVCVFSRFTFRTVVY